MELEITNICLRDFSDNGSLSLFQSVYVGFTSSEGTTTMKTSKQPWSGDGADFPDKLRISVGSLNSLCEICVWNFDVLNQRTDVARSRVMMKDILAPSGQSKECTVDLIGSDSNSSSKKKGHLKFLSLTTSDAVIIHKSLKIETTDEIKKSSSYTPSSNQQFNSANLYINRIDVQGLETSTINKIYVTMNLGNKIWSPNTSHETVSNDGTVSWTMDHHSEDKFRVIVLYEELLHEPLHLVVMDSHNDDDYDGFVGEASVSLQALAVAVTATGGGWGEELCVEVPLSDLRTKRISGTIALTVSLEPPPKRSRSDRISQRYASYSEEAEMIQRLIQISSLNTLLPEDIDVGMRILQTRCMVEDNKLRAMSKVLRAHPLLVDATDKEGHSSLHLCVTKGLIREACFLIEHGAKADTKSSDGLTVILTVCQMGGVDMLSLLLDRGARMEDVDTDGNSCLHLCVKNNLVEEVKFLLMKGAKLRARNNRGLTPFLTACEMGYIELITIILSKANCLQDVDNNGNTALHICASKCYLDCIKLLLEKGANILEKNQEGLTPLHMTCYQSNNNNNSHKFTSNDDLHKGSAQDMFEVSISKIEVVGLSGANMMSLFGSKNDPYVTMSFGSNSTWKPRTSTKWDGGNDVIWDGSALVSGQWKVLVTRKELLEQSLKVSVFDENRINSDVFLGEGTVGLKDLLESTVASNELARTVELEVKLSDDKKRKDRGLLTITVTLTPIPTLDMEATQIGLDDSSDNLFGNSNQEEVVKYLLEKGPTAINETDNRNHTTLHFCIMNGCSNIIPILLDSNANINFKNYRGSTPLHLACMYGRLVDIELLIRHEASTNEIDEDGWSPLQICVSNGQIEETRCLLDHGADFFIKTKEGNTLLHTACRVGGYVDIVSLLLDKGVNINEVNNDGESALHISVKNSFIKVTELLLMKGADLTIKSRDGSTALHALCRVSGKIDIESATLAVISIRLKSTKNVKMMRLFGQQNDPYVTMSLESKPSWTPRTETKWGAGNEVIWDLDDSREDWKISLNKEDLLNEKLLITVMDENNLGTDVLIGKSELHLPDITTDSVFESELELFNKNFTKNRGQLVLTLQLTPTYEDKRTEDKKNVDPAVTLAIMQMLLNHQISIDETDKDGKSALHLCVRNSFVLGAKLLIEHGANIRLRSKAGRNVLHAACRVGGFDTLKMLVEKGANINEADVQGDCPLNITLAKGYIEESCLLVESGGDPSSLKKKLREKISNLALETRKRLISSYLKRDLNSISSLGKDLIILLVNISAFELWSHLIDTEECDYIKFLLQINLDFTYAKDVKGRIIINVATDKVKEAINSILLWHGRYRITENRPEHQSATCFVFKAIDESDCDEQGSPRRVALKLMRNKSQFLREIEIRTLCLEDNFVVNTIRTVPETLEDIHKYEDHIDVKIDERSNRSLLNKSQAEAFFCIVFPLADRNMFVALKQERFAGRNWEEIRHILLQLLKCIEHIHKKGIIHGDLKALNVVRMINQWKLIDFDASCTIGKDYIGSKYSSAFVPPEAIFVDITTGMAAVKSEQHRQENNLTYELLVAQESYDIWSLGCLFYQMCTDCKQLFSSGQDDNLSADASDADNLWHLAAWTDNMKVHKLEKVSDGTARNLLAQMLNKDPSKRPDIARILLHPFITKKKSTRMIGEEPTYDVFLSYRVASDKDHTEYLYNRLIREGLNVWWDSKCLKDGEDWEEGFCAGLISSRIFVCLLSKQAINNPDKPFMNFSNLTSTSHCDNVLLEHRFALELKDLGLIDYIFPVIIGNKVAGDDHKYAIDWQTIYPKAPDICVQSIEDKLNFYMNEEAFGTPLQPNRTVKSVFEGISKSQGALIEGDYEEKMSTAAERITHLARSTKTTTKSTVHIGSLQEALRRESLQTVAVSTELTQLKRQLAAALEREKELEEELTRSSQRVNKLEEELTRSSQQVNKLEEDLTRYAQQVNKLEEEPRISAQQVNEVEVGPVVVSESMPNHQAFEQKEAKLEDNGEANRSMMISLELEKEREIHLATKKELEKISLALERATRVIDMYKELLCLNVKSS